MFKKAFHFIDRVVSGLLFAILIALVTVCLTMMYLSSHNLLVSSSPGPNTVVNLAPAPAPSLPPSPTPAPSVAVPEKAVASEIVDFMKCKVIEVKQASASPSGTLIHWAAPVKWECSEPAFPNSARPGPAETRLWHVWYVYSDYDSNIIHVKDGTPSYFESRYA
jgi:hypothetical protein